MTDCQHHILDAALRRASPADLAMAERLMQQALEHLAGDVKRTEDMNAALAMVRAKKTSW